ncbi:hypothetical protein [Labrys neptuniae]
MPYVQRTSTGAISGIYSNSQRGYAEEWLPDDDPAVIAFQAPAPAAKTVIFKADIWRRATDVEAATIDAQLNAQPVRLRRMWQDSQTLSTGDEMYPIVKAAFDAAFGGDRAAELLEPTAQ